MGHFAFSELEDYNYTEDWPKSFLPDDEAIVAALSGYIFRRNDAKIAFTTKHIIIIEHDRDTEEYEVKMFPNSTVLTFSWRFGLKSEDKWVFYLGKDDILELNFKRNAGKADLIKSLLTFIPQ